MRLCASSWKSYLLPSSGAAKRSTLPPAWGAILGCSLVERQLRKRAVGLLQDRTPAVRWRVRGGRRALEPLKRFPLEARLCPAPGAGWSTRVIVSALFRLHLGPIRLTESLSSAMWAMRPYVEAAGCRPSAAVAASVIGQLSGAQASQGAAQLTLPYRRHRCGLGACCRAAVAVRDKHARASATSVGAVLSRLLPLLPQSSAFGRPGAAQPRQDMRHVACPY